MSVIIAYPTEKVFPQIYKFSVRRKSIFPSGQGFAGVKWCGFVPVVRPCSANTRKVIACHCEERSDGTIRIPRRERGTLHPCPGVRTPTRPVIARSEATWQSVSPAAAHNEKQHLGRIRSSLRIRLKCYFSLPFSAGTRIATPVCALVRNDMLKEGRVRWCKDVVRNDMLKTGRCAQVQGRFPAAPRQCPQIMQTRGKFMDVIARSEATWQSVLLAVAQSGKQYFGQIRKA